MSLIPIEFKKDLGESGYLNYDSFYAERDLRGLFRSPCNQKYLENILYDLLKKPSYIENVQFNLNLQGSSNVLSNIFAQNEYKVKNFVDVFSYRLPDPEYLSSTNPIQQLSYTNGEFITDTAQNLIMNPSLIQEDYYYVDPQTGFRKESIGQEYSPASYSTGYWDPLEDVKSRPENLRAGYWKPIDVTFAPNIPSKSPGHRYNSDVYNGNSGCRSDKKFPVWNMNKRHYDRGDDGFRSNGNNDRRVQTPSRYNMFDLINKPSY